jgi:hypothetical protein
MPDQRASRKLVRFHRCREQGLSLPILSMRLLVGRGFLDTYLRELPVPWARPSFRLRLTRTRQSARQCDSEELQASVQHLFEEFQNSLWDRLENHKDVHVRDADEQLAG